MPSYDAIVIGAGFSGASVARALAELDKKVLLLEERACIGGNAYDYKNDDGILIHKYGPHIFHTNDKDVYNFLSRFTNWRKYDHKVVANINGLLVPLPFNFSSIDIVFKDNADTLKQRLIQIFGANKKVSILDLLETKDDLISSLANYIYENIFMHYSEKQWGTHFKNIDPDTFKRVPINTSYDDRYFQDTWQGMPLNSYFDMFKNMLDHPLITLCLSTKASKRILLQDSQIYLDNNIFEGQIIYTGSIDSLFDFKYGRLPYRTLDFKFETHNKTNYQQYSVVNYTVDKPYTRITEFKKLTGQILDDCTSIVKEYPFEYTGDNNQIPYYPIISEKNIDMYNKYNMLAQSYKNLHLLGRLAQYKYYNMDTAVLQSLNLIRELF